MIDIHIFIQSAFIGLASVWWVPSLLRQKPRGFVWGLAAVFLALFVLNMIFLPDKYSIGESLVRSTLVGLIPIGGGFLYVWLLSKQK